MSKQQLWEQLQRDPLANTDGFNSYEEWLAAAKKQLEMLGLDPKQTPWPWLFRLIAKILPRPDHPPKQLLRQREVLNWLGIDEHELNQLVESKILNPHHFRPGSRRWFLVSEIKSKILRLPIDDK